MSEDSQTRIFFDTSRILQQLESAISSAKKYIYMDYYIFALDQVGHSILNKLIDVSRRGIHVRLLVDGFGTAYWSEEIRKILPEKSVEFRIYNPLPWPLRHWSWAHSWLLLWRINKRNHQKLALFDGTSALVGSQNIHGPVPPWRETAVWIEGDDVRILEKSFLATWFRSFFFYWKAADYRRVFKYEKKRNEIILFNDNWFDHRRNFKLLVRNIKNATNRIWITTPYFIPTLQLTRELILAQRRGVDVRIIIPGPVDIPIVKWVSHLYLAAFLHRGIRIYEYQKNFLHAKQMLIDNEIQVGSTNLNRRSLYHDLELDVRIHERSIISSVETQFIRDMEDSVPVPFEDWRIRSLLHGLVGRLAYVFRNWL